MKYTNTKLILENDFKVFPPKPLKLSQKKPIEVIIRKNSKLVEIKRSLKAIKQIFNKIHKTNINIFESKSNSKLDDNAIQDVLDAIQRDIDSKANKYAPSILIKILISIVYVFKYMGRGGSSKTTTHAFVDYFDTSTIYYLLKPEVHIISHENIHILQHRYFINIYKILKFNPSEIIDKISSCSFDKKECYKYLCKQSELEARLHELVVFLYSRDKKLPSPLQLSSDFIKLIVSAGENVQITRSSEIDLELRIIFECFVVMDRDEFLVDTLIPLLYSNLILYYGDNMLSYKIKRRFLKVDNS